jgi:hypothetical protein
MGGKAGGLPHLDSEMWETMNLRVFVLRNS